MKPIEILNQAIERTAATFGPEHWQALVAVRGVKYPHTHLQKINILKELFIGKGGKEVCLRGDSLV